MSAFRPKLKRQQAYKPIRAKFLNALMEKYNDDARQVGPVKQVKRGSGGPAQMQIARLTITGLPTVPSGGPTDYLQCVQYVEGTEGEEIRAVIAFMNVAKPLGVRPSRLAHNGLTFTYADHNTRVATDGATIETQTLVEPYVIGDEIMAVNIVTGGTGVVTWYNVNGAPEAVVFQELPSTPRWWAVEE